MGRFNIVVPDDLERQFRVAVAERLGGEKGAISKAVCDGIRLWLKEGPARKK